MTESEIVLHARAKVNLALDVLGMRPDGYHDVVTVLQPLRLADILRIHASSAEVEITCTDPEVPAGEGNLVLRAARLLQLATGTRQGARLHIEKQIPIAAGLGGGSADAATALIGLNQLWETGLTLRELTSLAEQVGSDVPYCLLNHTALGEGRGERLTLLPPAPSMAVVVAVPRVTWAGPKTATVFKAFRLDRVRQHPDIVALRAALAARSAAAVAAAMGNVLEPVATGMHPIIAEIKQAMLSAGAQGACMTGAGPAVVGCTADARAAASIASAVRPLADRVIVTETLTTGALGGD